MLHYQCMDKWMGELGFHYNFLSKCASSDCPDVLPWTVSMSYANPINIKIVNGAGQAKVLNASVVLNWKKSLTLQHTCWYWTP